MHHEYLEKITAFLEAIDRDDQESIARAADLASEAIQNHHWVNLFGSGHSAIPALDAFPRYGSFVGFRPILDPRLLWHVPSGPGGAPELLWIERQPGYIEHFLEDFPFEPGEVFVVYSHGGMNAAPVEAAVYAKERGFPVIAVTSRPNYESRKAEHPSGKKLADVADVVIDTHIPPEDSLVHVPGTPVPVAAGSTVAVVAITMTLLSETAKRLAQGAGVPPTFVSPNVAGVGPGHNDDVYREYRAWKWGRQSKR